ncbi:hypothetical protein HPB51_018703 [Rhipicephalus microplus]|uniref:Uncharacterized protein n=1 Tax=Rhipicephalus microplus TaxID=6941 RepID=A0A9J6DIZ0_RHIMP|nr:hypothetical protein HPB51_018703 [Rhipicephalus microplus]
MVVRGVVTAAAAPKLLLYGNRNESLMDFHMADLKDFIYSKAKVTSLRIVDVDDPVAAMLDKKIDALEAANAPTLAAPGEQEKEEDYEGDDDDHVKFPLKLSTDAAMLYDAVKLFALSLIEWNGGKDAAFPALDCREDKVADDNNTDELIAVMKKVNAFDGLTGVVKLDNKGVRTDIKLYVSELGFDGLEEIGTWSPSIGLNITEDEEDEDDEDDEVLRVLSVPVSPFMMVNEVDGKSVYSGFCVDLLDKLSQELNFKYELHVMSDGARGAPNDTGHWSGMIGDVIAGKADVALADLTITEMRERVIDFTLPYMTAGLVAKADVALADLTITEMRERVIDFTLPYMTAGLVAVTKKGQPRSPGGIWAFFLPLTREESGGPLCLAGALLFVWIYILLATACTVFVMYISARLSFREWMLVDDGKGGECMENRLNLFNCFLFVLTTLLHQRVSLDPR